VSVGLHLPGRRWLGFESSAFIAPRRDAMADAVAAHERYTCPMDPPPRISASCVREKRDDPSRDTDGRSRLHHTNPRKGGSRGISWNFVVQMWCRGAGDAFKGRQPTSSRVRTGAEKGTVSERGGQA